MAPAPPPPAIPAAPDPLAEGREKLEHIGTVLIGVPAKDWDTSTYMQALKAAKVDTFLDLITLGKDGIEKLEIPDPTAANPPTPLSIMEKAMLVAAVNCHHCASRTANASLDVRRITKLQFDNFRLSINTPGSQFPPWDLLHPLLSVLVRWSVQFRMKEKAFQIFWFCLA